MFATLIDIWTGVSGRSCIDAHFGDIADVDARQPDRRAFAQTPGIVKISGEVNFACEPTARAAHQEDQNHEDDAGDDDGESDAELRPFELFLARHGYPVNRKKHDSKRNRFSSREFLGVQASRAFAGLDGEVKQ